jgi:hypothetical protein
MQSRILNQLKKINFKGYGRKVLLSISRCYLGVHVYRLRIITKCPSWCRVRDSSSAPAGGKCQHLSQLARHVPANLYDGTRRVEAAATKLPI